MYRIKYQSKKKVVTVTRHSKETMLKEVKRLWYTAVLILEVAEVTPLSIPLLLKRDREAKQKKDPSMSTKKKKVASKSKKTVKKKFLWDEPVVIKAFCGTRKS